MPTTIDGAIQPWKKSGYIFCRVIFRTPHGRKDVGRAWHDCRRDGALEVDRVQHVAQHALLNLRAAAHHRLLQGKALALPAPGH